jgi:hypothetical protein
MACPYFMPAEKLENGAFLHVGRLPLGCGWSGRCTAPGHQDEIPSTSELQEFCNLGYAHACGRLPPDRAWDSIRFGARTVVRDANSDADRLIQLRYVCERDHRPADHGVLQFDPLLKRWEQTHQDRRVQRMAECFLESYLEKRKKQDITPSVA